MRRSVPIASFLLVLCPALFAAAQSPSSKSSQEPAASSSAPSSPPGASPSQAPAVSSEAKKPKKVWTNENLSEANGPVSVVGDTRNLPTAKRTSNKPADAQYVASVRKQLEKLQGQIGDVDKQLGNFKNFNEGKPSPMSGNLQMHRSYSGNSIDAQIHSLEEKKKKLQASVDDLLDEARKRGVEPGQLR